MTSNSVFGPTDVGKTPGSVVSKGTLVVVKLSLVGQWVEVRVFCPVFVFVLSCLVCIVSSPAIRSFDSRGGLFWGGVSHLCSGASFATLIRVSC